MKKEKNWQSLITNDEVERYTKGFGVSVTGGSLGGGRTVEIQETEHKITVVFSGFFTQVGDSYNLKPRNEMPYDKHKKDGSALVIERCDGYLVISENGDSFLILCQNVTSIIERFKKMRAASEQ